MRHEYGIVAPIGGFGNHVRWLALLDNKFSVDINRPYDWTKESYNAYKGPSWPQEFVEFENLPAEFQTECRTLLNLDFVSVPFSGSPADRADYILSNVYSDSRTWSNWLITERKFRNLLQGLITFDHKPLAAETTIYVESSPGLAYYSYRKFNSTLNNQTKEEFLITVEQENSQRRDSWIVISSDILFNEELDRGEYNKLIQAFNLDDNYEQANRIHQQWYKLHKKAEREIVQDLAKMYMP